VTSVKFQRLVRDALDTLPARFRRHLSNVAVVVEREPSRDILDELEVAPDNTLFGLYQGTPLTARPWDYGNVLPDRITIFQGPIEDECGDDEDEMVTVIGETLIHEVGHFFGLSEEEIEHIEEQYWHSRHGEPGPDEGAQG
jgi:predicted Zn-dependent protease with MMP-like domain